jgi:hypothetical protein
LYINEANTTPMPPVSATRDWRGKIIQVGDTVQICTEAKATDPYGEYIPDPKLYQGKVGEITDIYYIPVSDKYVVRVAIDTAEGRNRAHQNRDNRYLSFSNYLNTDVILQNESIPRMTMNPYLCKLV